MALVSENVYSTSPLKSNTFIFDATKKASSKSGHVFEFFGTKKGLMGRNVTNIFAKL